MQVYSEPETGQEEVVETTPVEPVTGECDNCHSTSSDPLVERVFEDETVLLCPTCAKIEDDAREDERKAAEEASKPKPKPEYVVPQVLLPWYLAPLVGAAPKENARYGLTGVRLKVLDNNQFQVEATDGACVVRVVGQGGDPNEFPYVPGFMMEPQEKTLEGTIQAAAWKTAFKSIDRKERRDILKCVGMTLTKHQVAIGTIGENFQAASFTSPQVDGRWPPTDAVIPQTKPITTVQLDARRLMNLLAVAEAIVPDTERVSFAFDVYGPEKPVCLRLSNDRCKMLGIIMPLTRHGVDVPASVAKANEEKQAKDKAAAKKESRKEALQAIFRHRWHKMYNALRAVTTKSRASASKKAMESARAIVAEIKRDILLSDAWQGETGLTKTQEELDKEIAEADEEGDAEGE